MFKQDKKHCTVKSQGVLSESPQLQNEKIQRDSPKGVPNPQNFLVYKNQIFDCTFNTMQKTKFWKNRDGASPPLPNPRNWNWLFVTKLIWKFDKNPCIETQKYSRYACKVASIISPSYGLLHMYCMWLWPLGRRSKATTYFEFSFPHCLFTTTFLGLHWRTHIL